MRNAGHNSKASPKERERIRKHYRELVLTGELTIIDLCRRHGISKRQLQNILNET